MATHTGNFLGTHSAGDPPLTADFGPMHRQALTFARPDSAHSLWLRWLLQRRLIRCGVTLAGHHAKYVAMDGAVVPDVSFCWCEFKLLGPVAAKPPEVTNA